MEAQNDTKTLAVIGSRSFGIASKGVDKILHATCSHLVSCGMGNVIIRSGGASGVDKMGAMIARTYGFMVQEILPNWSGSDGKFNRSAGFARNGDIIKPAHAVLAIWDGMSKGTLDSIKLAQNLKKPLFVAYPDVWERDALMLFIDENFTPTKIYKRMLPKIKQKLVLDK